MAKHRLGTPPWFQNRVGTSQWLSALAVGCEQDPFSGDLVPVAYSEHVAKGVESVVAYTRLSTLQARH
jgi:hypothetical protein